MNLVKAMTGLGFSLLLLTACHKDFSPLIIQAGEDLRSEEYSRFRTYLDGEAAEKYDRESALIELRRHVINAPHADLGPRTLLDSKTNMSRNGRSRQRIANYISYFTAFGTAQRLGEIRERCVSRDSLDRDLKSWVTTDEDCKITDILVQFKI